jgi:hypothetical protein
MCVYFLLQQSLIFSNIDMLTMRNSAAILVSLLFSASSQAQGVFSNKTNAALEKVIQDYPNRFRNIKGELIVQNPQTTEYRSTVDIPGSSSCIVTRYNSTKNEVYGWACVIFEGDDFDLVKNKFREIFGQIKNTIIKIEGQKTFILNGQYEMPTEGKKFTSILFDLLPAVGELKKLKVELALQYEISGWKISLSVYDRDRKDDEPAAINGR